MRWDIFESSGVRRQESGDRSQETGDRRQESGDRRVIPMRQYLLIVMLCILPLTGARAENAIGEKAIEFTLQDQYEKTVSLKQYQGRLVVLIASDKEGKAQNSIWAKAIRDKYADRVSVQGVADVSSVPFFLKGMIRSDFKKERDSILLDWKGEVFKAYDITKGVSNVILVDKDGMIRHRTSGLASPEAVQALFLKIDALH
jgi:peroxiredoxin